MYNQITVVGRWVKDTEVIVTNTGTEIMNATIAVSDPFRKEHTDFIDVVAFKHVALNTNKFTSKGSKILVSGKLQQNTWENNEGQKRSKHEIVANQIVFLDDKPKEGQSVAPTKQESFKQAQGEPITLTDSELPF